MDLLILALVGVSSAITLIVAFILCAKRQSFTIEHDYDPNYISPSARAKNAYRVRHVHQPITNVSIENGHSKSRDEFVDKNDFSAKTSNREAVANNNVKVDVVKETPEARLQGNEGSATRGKPSHPDKGKMKQTSGSEVQREPSTKRKAPAAPGVSTPGRSTPGRSTPSGASSPAELKSATSPSVSVAKPTQSATTPSKAPVPSGQKAATGSQQRQSKKAAAPSPKQTPTKAAVALIKKEAPTKTLPKAAAPVKKAAPTSGTSSLPRATKTTPSPEKLHYVKKSSTLPGRSSKRQAPVAPGQAQAVALTVPKAESAEPSNKNTTKADDVNSKLTVAPGQNPRDERATSGSNASVVAEKRISRNVLDRLPSLPKENSFDSGLDVKEPGIASISNGSDSIDGPHDAYGKDSLEEDPYSVIRNRKMSKESVENNIAVDYEESKSSAPIETDGVVNSFAPQKGDQNDEETPVAKDDGIVLEIVPDVKPDGNPTEAAFKVTDEPPYAKVIKRNKRNRANVRVHFNMEHPEETQPKKPPTPGALVSMNGEKKDENPLDDNMIIPEGTSYD